MREDEKLRHYEQPAARRKRAFLLMVRSIAQRCVSNHEASSFETHPSGAPQDED